MAAPPVALGTHMVPPPVALDTHMAPPVAEAGEGTSRNGVAD